MKEIKCEQTRKRIRIFLTAARDKYFLQYLYSLEKIIKKRWGLVYAKILQAYKRQEKINFVRACVVIESVFFLFTGEKYDVGEVMWGDVMEEYKKVKKEMTF